MKHTHLIPVAILVLAGAFGCSTTEDDPMVSAEHAGFCSEHQIAEAQCPFCNPGLIQTMGPCPGHGVPEALCYQCNPALVPAFQAVGDWCAGHERPESQCYLCNPGLDPNRRVEAPSVAGTGTSEIPAVVSGLRRAQIPPVAFCSTNALVVQLADADIVREAGLELAMVERRPVTATLECNAEIAYNGNRYARLSSQIPGVVVSVEKDLGHEVAAGDVMATIRSTQLGAAKSIYLQARAHARLWEQNHARQNKLLEQGFSAEREALETETSLAEARIAVSEAEQGLLSLGLSVEQVAEVARTGDTGALYAVTASIPGLVVARDAVMGEVVDDSRPLFAVADVSTMWALLEVYESDVRAVRTGQPVVVRVAGLPGENFAGHITWVSSQLDPQTRTLRARAELDNGHRSLRDNMFAQAAISVHDGQESVVVPVSAVQWEGCCNVVFVKKSDTEFEPRKVHLGISTGTVYEVLAGLDPGETVVTQGSFLLKTEILKGSIGAGCCEVQPGS